MDQYSELHRPQFHFTARENWINDPNGLVFHDGTWHLFFQHNIEGPVWGKMWWGHAVSSDLLHWRQVEHALYPDEMGSMFSGSAVVDHHNTSGLGTGAILLFYTAFGKHVDPNRPTCQCLAFSTDGGRSWAKYDGNPVVEWMEGDNRDPKVVWHEATGKWIMALYLEDDRYCLLNSPDGLNWTRFQDLRLEGDSECPDFFQLKDESGEERWVFAGAGGAYQVGRFDGREFVAETPVLNYELGRNGYAAQTWSNAPDNRHVQVSWMAGGIYPEMPFNQQLSIPVELSLLGAGGEAKIVRWPVKELEAHREKVISISRMAISYGTPLIAKTDAKSFDVSFKVKRQAADGFYVLVRGHPLAFDWRVRTLTVESSGRAKMSQNNPTVELPGDESLEVRLVIDKTSIEVFLDGGKISASFCYLPAGYIHPLVLHSYTGEQMIEDFELHEIPSTWSNNRE